MLATVYQYFTLDEWKAMANAIKKDDSLTADQKFDLLSKFPSTSL